MFKQFFKDKQNIVALLSFWIHTVFQLVFIFYFTNSTQFTFIYHFYSIIIFFITLQFPFTALIIIISQKISKKINPSKHLLFKITISMLIFVMIMIPLILWMVYTSINIIDYSFPIDTQTLIDLTFSLVFKYITPLLIFSEVLRQIIFIKMTYPEQFKSNQDAT